MSGMRAQDPKRYPELTSSLAEANQPNGFTFNIENDRSLMFNSSIRSHG
jgi:hypothetical protein